MVILSNHSHVAWMNRSPFSMWPFYNAPSSCIILRLFGTFCGHSLTAVLLLPLLVPLGVKLEEAGSKVNGWSWCTVAENPLTKGYLYRYPQESKEVDFNSDSCWKNPVWQTSWYAWSLSQLVRQQVVIFKLELANFWLFFWATFSGTGDCGPRNVVWLGVTIL